MKNLTNASLFLTLFSYECFAFSFSFLPLFSSSLLGEIVAVSKSQVKPSQSDTFNPTVALVS